MTQTKKRKIQIQYQTEKGTYCESYQEAQVMDALEKADFYLESYRMEQVAKLILDNFIITERPHDNLLF